jgi:ABC-type metal ion transport system substrate-binding protein
MTLTALKAADEDAAVIKNTKIKDDSLCAERKIATENAHSNTTVNVVATRTTTDNNDVFRGETKSKAKVAVESEFVKPHCSVGIKIDDEKKVEAIEGNIAGVVSII